jgi:alcohol dehydrogenase class IV
MIDPRRPFDFRDGERRIHYGRGRVAEAVDLLGGGGFTLLTTERASAAAPQLADAAGAVHLVRPGLVAEIAEELLAEVTGELVLALGGGRVVDVAKAIVAARGSGRAGAVPTTLSGAEMTRTHRQVEGTRGVVRAAIVINDPALVASQPVPELAASALNALGHAVEGPLTPRANPVATLAAHEGSRLVVSAFGSASREDAAEPDRDALALGALLCGYAIDSAGYGLHHVLAQTMVRVGGAAHGAANAVLLPHTARALTGRYPEEADRLARAADDAERLVRLTGAATLRELGVARDALDRCADAAATRTGDLANTPPAADRDEILAIYQRAW